MEASSWRTTRGGQLWRPACGGQLMDDSSWRTARGGQVVEDSSWRTPRQEQLAEDRSQRPTRGRTHLDMGREGTGPRTALATDHGLCRRLRHLRLRSRPGSAPWFVPCPLRGRLWAPGNVRLALFLRPAQSRRRRRASPREVGGGNGADLEQLCFDLRRHMRRRHFFSTSTDQ